MIWMKFAVGVIVAASLGGASAVPDPAKEYPGKPIVLIAPFAPERAADLASHVINERSGAMPGVLTFMNVTYPDLVINNWFALAGPAGMDDAIVQKLSRAVESAASSPGISEHLNKIEFVPQYMVPKELAEFMAAESCSFSKSSASA